VCYLDQRTLTGAPVLRPSCSRLGDMPIAAHGGLSYMAFSRNGDAGTTVALEDARAEIVRGEEQ
jgi:hypothetical protein